MRCSADFKNNNIKMSGSTRSMNHDMEALWFSLLPKNASFDRNVEEEILKLTLLLQSTQMLVTGLHQKQKSALSQLKAVQDQLRVATDLKDKSESDQDALRKELQALKIEFHSAQEEARKQQKKADDAVAKNERLKKKISAEVEVRLHKMFNDCLQQNKAATVLDMMTQMCQDNVTPDEAFSVEETLPKRSERVAFLKSSALNKFTDVGSPDVIPGTPESNQSCSKLKKPKPSLKPSSKHKVVESAPSSPDVIGDTPPLKNIERKDNRKRNEKCIRLFKREEDDIENKPIVFVKDTQDVDDDTCFEKRPALKENITVPETLDPDNYGKKSTKVQSENTTYSNKENEKISLNQSDEKSVKIADLSTDAEFPSTPKKASLHNNNSKSPILGKSGHKSKKSVRQSSGLADMSLKKSPRRNKDLKTKSRTSLNMTLLSHNKSKNSSQGANNLLMNDDSNTSYEIRPNKKILKSKQPTIFDAFSKESQNKSKLSLSKRKKDISSRPEFNGGQRSAAEHSVDISHLSENEQVKIAIENSMREKPLEDTDATLFIPECSQLHGKFETSGKEIPNTTKSTSEIKPVETNPDEKEVFFEPMFASTALEGFTQKKPKSAFSLQEAADIGKPLHSSTEKVCDENSALNELHKYLEENNEDEEVEEDEDMEKEKLEEGKATGFAPETSYDRLPPKSNSPNYAYKGPVVRKKNERKNLKGFDCSRCAEYYEAAFAGDDERAKKIILDGCSRHRDRAKNGPRSRTPPGYWDLEFPPTQVVRKRQQETPSPS